MGTEDVERFLASVGSPLAQGGEAQKTLPADAVLQLLNARIESLAAPLETAPKPTTSDSVPGLEEYLDEDMVAALRAYASATAQYTYTSAVANMTKQLSEAMQHVADVHTALDARDWERLPTLLPDAQEALLLVGIEVDFVHNVLRDVPGDEALAHSATVHRLREHCQRLLVQMHSQVNKDWERAVQVLDAGGDIVLAVQNSPHEDPESANTPSLLDLWEYAQGMNLGESVAERIASLLERKIVRPMLGDVADWHATQSTTSDDILTQLVLSQAPSSDPLQGAAIPALVQVLVFLRETLFLPSAHDGPAIQDALLAPTLQVLVSHTLVPKLVASLKTYLLRCLPTREASLEAAKEATDRVTRLALQVHEALVEHGYARASTESGSMVRRPGWAPLEPLTDLPTWVEHVGGLCTEHILGGVLDHVRAAILRMDDKSWDMIDVERQVPDEGQRPPPRNPFKAELKPKVQETKQAPPPKIPEPVKSPVVAPKPAVPAAGKAKKPTLGGVKKLGATPLQTPTKPAPAPAPAPAPPPAPTPAEPVPEPDDDDWGWGDDDLDNEPKQPTTEAPKDAPADDWDMDDAWGDVAKDTKPSETATPGGPDGAADDMDDDWGWGSDGEVEEMLGEPAPPSEAQPPPAPEPEDSSFDAWGMQEPDVESPETEHVPLPPEPTPPPAPSMKSVSIKISARCRAVVAHAEEQFGLLSHVSDPRLRHAVAQSLLECCQLYRAMMPAVHAASLQHVPLLSMLFANDCDYLADEMRTYADRAAHLPGPAVKSGPLSLDAALQHEAAALRSVGSQWRQAQLALQTAALHECLDQADSFARTDDDARNATCERAIAQVSHILQHLVTVWRPVLSQDVLLHLLGELVQSVFARVQASIEDLEDISEAESTRLAVLCRTLLDAQTALFSQAAQVDTEAAGALAATSVASWFKFSYLPELLTGSLADIEFLLFDSGGALLDYTREEITALIRGLFADTPNRRRLLERIQRAPWASTQVGLS